MSYSNTKDTQVIEISTGNIKDMIAQLLYACGKVPHSVDIVNIKLPFHLDHSIPVEVKLKKRKEVKVRLINGS